MINRVLFLYDMDSFTSPPTLPKVGLDGLASERKYTIIFSVKFAHFHQYYTDYMWGKIKALDQDQFLILFLVPY